MTRFSGFKGWISVAAMSGLIVMGCGDDDNNPTSSSGAASVPDHSGANTAITTSNARTVMTEVAGVLNGSLGRVMSAAASKPATQATLQQTISVNNKTVPGLQSGSVTINGGTFAVSGTGQTLKADLVFDDFSDDGQLFMGGTVNIDLNMNLGSFDPSNPQSAVGGLSLSFVQKGDLAFSGKYKGVLKMDMNISIDGGIPSINGSATVGGDTVTF
jgi:hypothetical protein